MYERGGSDKSGCESSFVFGYKIEDGMRTNEFGEIPVGLVDKIAHFIYVFNETRVFPSVDEYYRKNSKMPQNLSIGDAPTDDGEAKEEIDMIRGNIKDEGIVIGCS